MVTVTVNLSSSALRFSHKEADSFYFYDGILFIKKGVEKIAAYPQGSVVGVEKGEINLGNCCRELAREGLPDRPTTEPGNWEEMHD